MKQKLTLLLIALFTTVGAWATDVTVIDKTKDATTYGSLSETTFTTNAASGMAGVTIEGIKGTTATNFAYGACLALTSTASGTITMTAPDGYIITGYNLTARSNTYAVSYTLTPSAGGSAVVTSTGGVTLTVSGLDAQTASFTYSATSANSFYIPALTITLLSTSAQTVNVTYELWEGDSKITEKVEVQEANSAVNAPSSWTSSPIYSYAITGEIGDEDCTIKVIRTQIGIITASDLSNSKCYTIRTNDRGWWVVPNEATAVTSTNKAGLATSASDLKQQFALISYDDTQDDANDGIYLYSVSAKKFISKSGNYTTLTATPGDKVTLLASTGDSNFPTVVAFSGTYHAGISNGYNPAIITHYNSLADGGNRCAIIEAADFDATEALAALDDYFHPSYTVTYIVKDGSDNVLFTSAPVGTTNGATITTLPAEYQRSAFYTYNTVDVTISTSGNTNVEFVATPKDNAPVKYTADTNNPYYYNLNIRSKYLVYNTEATGEVTLQDESEPFNADASWAFIGNPYAGFKVINKTKGTSNYLTYTEVTTARPSGNNIQFIADASFTNQYWIIDTNNNGFVLRMKENTNIYFHHDSSGNYLRTCSVSEWSYVHNDAGSTIVASTDEDVLFVLYNSIKDVTYGDGLGEYSAENISTNDAQATITNVGAVIDASLTAAYADAYAALKALADVTEINMPAGKFIRLYSPTANLWMGNAASGKHPMVENKADAGIYYVTADNHIVSYNRGLALANSAGAPCTTAGNAGGTFTFGAVDYAGTYYVICGGYLIAWTDNYTNRNSGYDSMANWNIEEVTTLPVTISDARYATLYAPVALTIPTGVTAYTGVINGDWLTTTAIEGDKIPAETAVVLKANAGSYDFVTTTADPFEGENVLQGTIGGKAAASNIYVLAQPAGEEVGFYNATAGNVAGFKAYLETSADVKGFVFKFEDNATAIENVQCSMFNVQSPVYNLAGQRIQKMQKGVNIVNGKKILK